MWLLPCYATLKYFIEKFCKQREINIKYSHFAGTDGFWNNSTISNGNVLDCMIQGFDSQIRFYIKGIQVSWPKSAKVAYFWFRLDFSLKILFTLILKRLIPTFRVVWIYAEEYPPDFIRTEIQMNDRIETALNILLSLTDFVERNNIFGTPMKQFMGISKKYKVRK